jgi:hypothetical protein
MKMRIILFCLGALLLAQSTVAQERRIISRITGGINFDGIPDEEIWKTANSFPLVMHSPDNGKSPVQQTDVRLCFDDMYLYLCILIRTNLQF